VPGILSEMSVLLADEILKHLDKKFEGICKCLEIEKKVVEYGSVRQYSTRTGGGECWRGGEGGRE
jgi:hypothetical protein